VRQITAAEHAPATAIVETRDALERPTRTTKAKAFRSPSDTSSPALASRSVHASLDRREGAPRRSVRYGFSSCYSVNSDGSGERRDREEWLDVCRPFQLLNGNCG
jgi:hypothetical protein